MLDYATKLTQAYNKASTDIALACRGARPTPTDPKMALKGFLAPVGSKYAPVAGIIEELSKLDFNAVNPGPEREKQLKAAALQLKALKPVMSRYTTELNTVLTAQVPFEGQAKAALKACSPDVYRSVKVLKTELEAIAARAVQNWESFDKQDETDKINATGNKKVSKIDDDQERKQAKLVVNAKAALLTFSPKLKSALAKAIAAIQKIKGDPTPATYNSEMNNAGRDVSQNVANIRKWQAHPEIREMKAVKAMPSAAALADAIAEFGDGAKRSIDATATQVDVLNRLKEFSALVKEINTTYSDVMTGKLASKLAL